MTGDELGDPGALAIRTWVNDELRQDSTTADLIFGCADMIEYLTTAFPLEPGTIIATGTPAGVGAGFDPVGVDMSELMLAGGGPKCCTLELREKV